MSFLSTAQKHNRLKFEHNRPGPTYKCICVPINYGFVYIHIILQLLPGEVIDEYSNVMIKNLMSKNFIL